MLEGLITTMRIISGSARGTKLYTLEGMDTRPTLDRVKESLFNGTVEGKSFVGGVAGLAEESEFKIVDVFAEIEAEEFVGGLVGLTRNYKSKKIGNFEAIKSTGEFSDKEYGVATGRILKK